MISTKYVDEYIGQYKAKEIILNKDRKDLIYYLENVVLVQDGFWFDEKQIDNFVKFTEKWFFKLKPFQKFLISFIFLFDKNNKLVFDEFFWVMARGAGKNGLISALSAYFLSPLHNIQGYNVGIVANSEEQAQTSFKEVHDMLDKNPQLTDRRTGIFKNGLSKIRCRTTHSTLEFLTSNAKTKDSFRHGCVIFDEVHQYEKDDIISVLTSGLGKVPNPRKFFISTNGLVRDGVYDQKIRTCREILQETEFSSHTFPWICTLDDKQEAENTDLWQKAQPMFHKPLDSYSETLFDTVNREYQDIRRGIGDKTKWFIKRMNVSDIDLETSVATKEEVYATNRPIPDFENCKCIGGLDYASLKDFASVGLLFHIKGDWIWVTHSFIRKEFLLTESMLISPHIPEWQEKGLLTVVDEPTISIRHIVDWFNEMRDKYKLDILEIIGDTYRMDIVRPALEDEGYELEFIRRANSIQAQIAPQIEVLFAEKKLVFGDNPLMRWYTNNVYVKIDKFGNKTYEKKEIRKRKTDGFMAFTHAYFRHDLIEDSEPTDFMLENFYNAGGDINWAL